MISQHVTEMARAHRWTDPASGKIILPMNVCSTCGEDDDPESAARWEQDNDGDSHCPTCFAKIEPTL